MGVNVRCVSPVTIAQARARPTYSLKRAARPPLRFTRMEDAAATLLSALDDRDPTVIRAAMVSYADRVQGVRLQAKAYDLVARQHVQSALFAAPQLGPCAS